MAAIGMNKSQGMSKAPVKQRGLCPVLPVDHFPFTAVFHLVAEAFKGRPLTYRRCGNGLSKLFFSEYILRLAHHTVNRKNVIVVWIVAAGYQWIICPLVIQRNRFGMMEKKINGGRTV